jgi:hypothetical protein
MDKQEYELAIQKSYQEHVMEHGTHYFEGSQSEALDCDENGEPLVLSA